MLGKQAFSLILLCGLLPACATAPQPTEEAAVSSPSPAQQVASGKDPNERICREVAGTGWRFGSREECKTRAEWEASIPGGER
jgi:hypothetical protein